MTNWDRTWNTPRFVTETMWRAKRVIGYRVIDQLKNKCVRAFRVSDHGTISIAFYLANALRDDLNTGIE
jgi:hypothetical protein